MYIFKCLHILYLFAHKTYMFLNNMYGIYSTSTLTQHFFLFILTKATIRYHKILFREGQTFLASDWMVLNLLSSLQLIRRPPYSYFQN